MSATHDKLAEGGVGTTVADLQSLPSLVRWLAGGSRGMSSNTMAQHLTGLPCLRDSRPSHPHDPDDLDRCIALLEAVPQLRLLLEQMAKLSPEWAALVKNWDAIEACHLEEVGLGWTKARRAPKTYALMKHVLEQARKPASPTAPEAKD